MRKAIGDKYKSKDLEFLISCSDKDDDGKMNCEEFCMAVSVLARVSLKELKEQWNVFTTFDLDGNRAITCDELWQCMNRLGQELSKQECLQMVLDADKDGDERICFLEFVMMVKDAEDKAGLVETQNDMKEAFQLFDENGDGKIDRAELKQVMKSLHPESCPSEQEIEDMFQLADSNKDGTITFDEFCALMG